MKKSCLNKELNVVTIEDSENAINSSNEPKEHLTEEQLLINQKLKESGVEETGLGWLEKRHIFRTINVSLDTSRSERLRRSSPRLSRPVNSKPAKWIENSFESPKHEESPNKNNSEEKQFNTDPHSSKKLTLVQKSKTKCQESEESGQKSTTKSKAGEKLQRDVEALQGDSPKSSRRVHYINIEIEDKPKEECNSVSEGSNSGLILGKKRTTDSRKGAVETPKKLKMEESGNMVSPKGEVPSKVELKLEKGKPNAPFKIRDIKAIVSECDNRNKKWRETFLKYRCPPRWGNPIVKNCSEKWDGKQIPPKLLHRYQKYLSSKNLTHPVFLPVKSEISVDLNKLGSDIGSQSNSGEKSESREESGSDFKHLEEGLFAQGDSSVSGMENNLSGSAPSRETTGRMVLRNRNQQKSIISDNEFSSDDDEDWMVQKLSKKQKFNAKNKKAAEQSKQLLLKLEKCNINRGNGNEGGRRNDNKNDSSFTGGPIPSSTTINQAGGNTKPGPDPDSMVCPICNLRFKKQYIEGHATECASKTYKD